MQARLLHRVAQGAAALLVAGFIGGCAPAAPVVTATGPGAGTDTRPNATRGSTTAPDENIRVETGTNEPGTRSAAGAPASKAEPGTATRGTSTCAVHFDNRTDLYIGTYVDGRASGGMGPWGDVYTYAIAGPTRLYARATFTNGDVWTWGPVVVDCPAGGSYTWRLRN